MKFYKPSHVAPAHKRLQMLFPFGLRDTNWERLIPQGQASAQASFGGKVSAGTTVELSDVKR